MLDLAKQACCDVILGQLNLTTQCLWKEFCVMVTTLIISTNEDLTDNFWLHICISTTLHLLKKWYHFYHLDQAVLCSPFGDSSSSCNTGFGMRGCETNAGQNDPVYLHSQQYGCHDTVLVIGSGTVVSAHLMTKQNRLIGVLLLVCVLV